MGRVQAVLVAKNRDQMRKKKTVISRGPDNDAAKRNAITTSSHVNRCFLFRSSKPRVAPCRRSRAIERRHHVVLAYSSGLRAAVPKSSTPFPRLALGFSTIFCLVPPRSVSELHGLLRHDLDAKKHMVTLERGEHAEPRVHPSHVKMEGSRGIGLQDLHI